MTDFTHLEEHLQRDIGNLRERLDKMADLVFRQLDDAVAAFANGDRKLAYAVILNDHVVDLMEHHIDRLSQEFLVRHMPVAKQLRFVFTLAKVNSELERIGDYAEAIARRAVTLADAETVPQRERIVEMSKHAFKMLRDGVAAFLDDNPELAMVTLESDRAVDDMNSAIFSALAKAPTHSENLTNRFALLGLVNRIERVADRACNIAEEAVYVARGEVLRHLPREDVRVLFVCDHNSCRSQIAEGIARMFSPPHLIFTSAGADPHPVDDKAVEFLDAQGIDISRHRSKSMADVGPIEDFNVVITLSQAAKEALPKVPYHAVALNWEVSDPSKLTGTDEEIEAAYRDTFELLKQKIAEMSPALVGTFAEGIK